MEEDLQELVTETTMGKDTNNNNRNREAKATLFLYWERRTKRTEWLQGNYVPHTSQMTMRSA